MKREDIQFGKDMSADDLDRYLAMNEFDSLDKIANLLLDLQEKIGKSSQLTESLVLLSGFYPHGRLLAGG